MANFFKRLFGKKETEEKTSVFEDTNLDNQPDNVKFLNKCIRDACFNENELLKNKEAIEKAFPDEPELFDRIYFHAGMINAMASESKLTEDFITRVKKNVSDLHINEQTIDYIVSEKQKRPPRRYSAPLENELDRYALAFMLVPLLIETYNEAIHDGGVSPGREDLFWDTTIWKRIAGTMNYTRTDFDWNEISFQKHQIGQKLCVAITFPKPLKVPQAKYGLVVIDKEAHYFTLEKASKVSSNDHWKIEEDENYWVLGGVNNRKHINYGFLEGDFTISQFIERALEIGLYSLLK